MELQEEAKKHFDKLENTLAYQKNKFKETAKPIVQKEIDALEFVIQYAKEALAQRGVRV